MKEYIEALRAIWSCFEKDEKLEYEGEHYQFNLMTPNFKPPASGQPMVPITIAAVGPAMLRLAGEVCDGVRLHPFCTRKYIDQVVIKELETGMKRSDRKRESLEIVGGGYIVTGPDEETVAKNLEWVRYRVAFYGSTPNYFPVWEVHGLEDLGKKLHQMSREKLWDEMPNEIDDDVLNRLLDGCTYGGKPMTADDWAADKSRTPYHAATMASEDLVGPMQAQKNQNSWMARTKCLAQPLAMLWDVRDASGARDVWTSLDRIRGGADVFVRDSVGSKEMNSEKRYSLLAGNWHEMAWSPHTRWHAEQIWDVCERSLACRDEIRSILEGTGSDDPHREELEAAQALFEREANLFEAWSGSTLQRADLCVWEVAIDVVHAYEGIAPLTSGQKALRNARVPIAEYGLNSAQLGRHLSPGERYVSHVGRNQPTCWDPDGEDSELYAVDEDAGFGELGYGARVGEGPAARKPRPGQADGRLAQERAHTLAWWRWKWNFDSKHGDQFVAGYAKKFNHNASLAMGGSDPYGVANFSQAARKTMLQYASREIARNEAQFGRQLQLSAGVKAQTVEEMEREGIDPKGKNMGIQDELAPGAITRKQGEDGRSFVREYDQATGSGGFYGTWFVPTGSDSLEWSRGVRLFLRRDEYGDLYLPQHVDLQYLKPKKTEGGEEVKWTEELFWREILLSMASDDATKARLQQSSAELLTPGVARRAIEEQLKTRPSKSAMTGGARKQFYPDDYSKTNKAYLQKTLDPTTFESYMARRPKLFKLEVVPGSFDAFGRVRIGSALSDAKMTAVFPISVLKAAINSSTLYLSDELKQALPPDSQADDVRRQLRGHQHLC